MVRTSGGLLTSLEVHHKSNFNVRDARRNTDERPRTKAHMKPFEQRQEAWAPRPPHTKRQQQTASGRRRHHWVCAHGVLLKLTSSSQQRTVQHKVHSLPDNGATATAAAAAYLKLPVPRSILKRARHFTPRKRNMVSFYRYCTAGLRGPTSSSSSSFSSYCGSATFCS